MNKLLKSLLDVDFTLCGLALTSSLWRWLSVDFTFSGYLPFTVGFVLAWRLVDVFSSTLRWCNADLTGVEKYFESSLPFWIWKIYLKASIISNICLKKIIIYWLSRLREGFHFRSSLKHFSTGNSSISFRVFRYSHVPHTNGSKHNNQKFVLFVRRRQVGGGGVLDYFPVR